MQIKTIPFSELSHDIEASWLGWIAADSRHQSPFLHPEFSRAVNTATNDVECAIAFENDKPVSILPFQRIGKRAAGPVGGYLSDQQGWISSPGQRLHFTNLLDSTELRSFRFHMLPLGETPDLSCMALRRTTVYADIANGFESYEAKKKLLGSNVVSKLAQKERKISNEVGPLRIDLGYSNESFESFLQWKDDACRKRCVKNILATKPALLTVRSLIKSSKDDRHDFRLQYCRLMAGDSLVAVHLGLICHNRLAAWLPAYNPLFYRYSPGLLILMQLLRNCEQWGIHRVNFGTGEQPFKNRFMTDKATMLEGIADQRLIHSVMHCCWLKARDIAKTSILRRPLQHAWFHSNIQTEA